MVDNTQLNVAFFEESNIYDVPIINKNYKLNFIDIVKSEWKIFMSYLWFKSKK